MRNVRARRASAWALVLRASSGLGEGTNRDGVGRRAIRAAQIVISPRKYSTVPPAIITRSPRISHQISPPRADNCRALRTCFPSSADQ